MAYCKRVVWTSRVSTMSPVNHIAEMLLPSSLPRIIQCTLHGGEGTVCHNFVGNTHCWRQGSLPRGYHQTWGTPWELKRCWSDERFQKNKKEKKNKEGNKEGERHRSEREKWSKRKEKVPQKFINYRLCNGDSVKYWAKDDAQRQFITNDLNVANLTGAILHMMTEISRKYEIWLKCQWAGAKASRTTKLYNDCLIQNEFINEGLQYRRAESAISPSNGIFTSDMPRCRLCKATAPKASFYPVKLQVLLTYAWATDSRMPKKRHNNERCTLTRNYATYASVVTARSIN